MPRSPDQSVVESLKRMLDAAQKLEDLQERITAAEVHLLESSSPSLRLVKGIGAINESHAHESVRSLRQVSTVG